MEALQKGLGNLQRHIENMHLFGQSVVIAFNQYGFDTQDEMEYLRQWAAQQGVAFAINNSFAKGGDGAVELAQTVVKMIEERPSKPLQFAYELNDSVENKLRAIVQKIYRGSDIVLGKKAVTALSKIKKQGWDKMPICMAKTQYSFSDNPKLLNAPAGFTVTIEDLIVNTGAGFIVAVSGDIMRMPGLPEEPQALHIDLVNGFIEGLS